MALQAGATAVSRPDPRSELEFLDAGRAPPPNSRRLMDYGRGYSYGESMDKPTLGIVVPTTRILRPLATA